MHCMNVFPWLFLLGFGKILRDQNITKTLHKVEVLMEMMHTHIVCNVMSRECGSLNYLLLLLIVVVVTTTNSRSSGSSSSSSSRSSSGSSSAYPITDISYYALALVLSVLLCLYFGSKGAPQALE